MSVRDNLIAARKLIESPENWWQLHDGNPRSGRKCAILAISEIVKTGCKPVFHDNDPHYHPFFEILGTASPRALSNFNDEHTHAEVLNLFDRAIASLEPEQTFAQKLMTSLPVGNPDSVTA